MSTYSNWVYTRNPFVRPTKYSLQKLFAIVVDHASKLKHGIANPEIDMLFQRFEPISTLFTTHYRNWKVSVDFGRAATKELDELLEELVSLEVEDWDIRIRSVFPRSHKNYESLMGTGRKVFTKGGKELRINAVVALADKLATFPALSGLYLDVNTVATLLKEKRDEQIQHLKNRRDSLEALREMRKTVWTYLFQSLAYLTFLYPESPQRVTDFFRMELLRSTSTSPPSPFFVEETEEEEMPIEFDELFEDDSETLPTVDG